MTSTNYVAGIVKILEKPKLKTLKNDVLLIQFRGQLPQFKNTLIVNLTFWGNLAQNVAKYYKVNDYIMIEGYISLQDIKDKVLSSGIFLKKINLTVLKVYPFYSTLNYSENLIKNISE